MASSTFLALFVLVMSSSRHIADLYTIDVTTPQPSKLSVDSIESLNNASNQQQIGQTYQFSDDKASPEEFPAKGNSSVSSKNIDSLKLESAETDLKDVMSSPPPPSSSTSSSFLSSSSSTRSSSVFSAKNKTSVCGETHGNCKEDSHKLTITKQTKNSNHNTMSVNYNISGINANKSRSHSSFSQNSNDRTGGETKVTNLVPTSPSALTSPITSRVHILIGKTKATTITPTTITTTITRTTPKVTTVTKTSTTKQPTTQPTTLLTSTPNTPSTSATSRIRLTEKTLGGGQKPKTMETQRKGGHYAKTSSTASPGIQGHTSHHGQRLFTGFVQHVWLPNSSPRPPGPVDDGPFGSILWKDKKYLVSVLIPIGVGFAGAMMIIVMAYASRAWRKRKERLAEEGEAPRSFLEAVISPKNDDMAPLQESSDDEF